MSLLDAVRWPALIEDVAGSVGDQARGIALDYIRDERIVPLFRPGVGLAALVLHHSPILMRTTVARHGADLTADEADRLARWLVDASAIMLRLAAGTVDEPSEPAQPGVLFVDPELPDLPLLPLAAQVAERTGGLRVVAALLPPCIGGVHTATDGVIRLDPRRDPVACWPHELAHVLDPRLGRRGDAAADEAFAEALGRLLVEHQPWTVDQAMPLIQQAEAEVPTRDQVGTNSPPETVGDLPASDQESLMAFALLTRRG